VTVSDPVSVDLVVDDGPLPPPQDLEGPPRRRRVGLVLAALLALGVGLVAWPEAPPAQAPRADERAEAPALPEVPAPSDPRMLPWPGRGPLVTDESFVEQAAQAWRSQAAVRPEVDPPGEQVAPLWAGQVGTAAVALLQSVGEDGTVRLAQVSESRRPGNVQRGGLVLTQTAALPPGAAPPGLLGVVYTGGLDLGSALDLPGSALLQVLPAPGLLPEGSQLLRGEGARFLPVAVQPDGLSQPWLQVPLSYAEGPVVLAARTQGLEPGIEVAQLVRPGELLPSLAPVQLVEPVWGRTRKDLPEDYADATAAVRSLGLAGGRVGVLGSTPVADGRVALLQVDLPLAPPPGTDPPESEPAVQGSGVVTVYTRGNLQYVSPLQPLSVAEQVVVGAVRTPSGQVVAMAAGAPGASQTVLSADGEPLGVGPRVSAVALEPSRPVSEVAGQAYDEDQTYLGRAALPVAELAPVPSVGNGGGR
jgi:hypothetical protein